MPFHIEESATGWSFTVETEGTTNLPPRDGPVLRDIRHQVHNFARDVRLVGIRLKVQLLTAAGGALKTTSKLLALSDPLVARSPMALLLPSTQSGPRPPSVFRYLKESDEALHFRTYFKHGENYVATGVRFDYVVPAAWFDEAFPNSEVNGLNLSVRFLFSRYSNLPPHEPRGTLAAARFFPLVKYQFSANPAVDRSRSYHRIESIRFDYRLHLFIDSHHDVARIRTQPQIGNQAGLFKDNDVVGMPPAVVFAAIEKPLIREVVAPGLVEGVTALGSRKKLPPPRGLPRCWDNVHWWGARGEGQPLISAPGGFHAAHVHWRWGAAGETFSLFGLRERSEEIDNGGVPLPVQSHPWGGGSTRTLVDPGIWIQTIRAGVVKNDRSLDPTQTTNPPGSLSRETWESLFTSLRGAPALIAGGDDIVLWYSTEVHRSTRFPSVYRVAIFPMQTRPAAEYLNALGGTVFLHGIFFAHQAEETGLFVGTTEPQHWPRTAQQVRDEGPWYRAAQ